MDQMMALRSASSSCRVPCPTSGCKLHLQLISLKTYQLLSEFSHLIQCSIGLAPSTFIVICLDVFVIRLEAFPVKLQLVAEVRLQISLLSWCACSSNLYRLRPCPPSACVTQWIIRSSVNGIVETNFGTSQHRRQAYRVSYTVSRRPSLHTGLRPCIILEIAWHFPSVRFAERDIGRHT